MEANTKYATITIPGDNDIVYNVRKVTYTTSSQSDIYDLTQEYYFIAEESCYIPYYSGIGLGTSFFKIAYTPTDGSIKTNMKNGFKKLEMDNNGALVAKSVDSVSIGRVYSSIEGITCPTPSGNELSLGSESLINYKNQYPNKTVYPLITANIGVGDKTFVCEIQYALPEFAQVSLTYTGAQNDYQVELGNELYIPDESGTNYSKLTDASQIEFIEEMETSYLKSVNGTKLMLDYSKLDVYFSNKTTLTVKMRLTTVDDKTLDFVVVITKEQQAS